MERQPQTRMSPKAKQTDFEQFLQGFAHSIELAMAGEVDDALASLDEAQREAERSADGDSANLMAILYRFDTARKVLLLRHGTD